MRAGEKLYEQREQRGPRPWVENEVGLFKKPSSQCGWTMRVMGCTVGGSWRAPSPVAVIRGLDWAVIGGSRAEKQEGE